jgi:hypothetical protein
LTGSLKHLRRRVNKDFLEALRKSLRKQPLGCATSCRPRVTPCRASFAAADEITVATQVTACRKSSFDVLHHWLLKGSSGELAGEGFKTRV